jgi:hypothetical protein
MVFVSMGRVAKAQFKDGIRAGLADGAQRPGTAQVMERPIVADLR